MRPDKGVDARKWDRVRLGKEAAALRREARIIPPNGRQRVKAEYKAKVMWKTPYQTEMDLKR